MLPPKDYCKQFLTNNFFLNAACRLLELPSLHSWPCCASIASRRIRHKLHCLLVQSREVGYPIPVLHKTATGPLWHSHWADEAIGGFSGGQSVSAGKNCLANHLRSILQCPNEGLQLPSLTSLLREWSGNLLLNWTSLSLGKDNWSHSMSICIPRNVSTVVGPSFFSSTRGTPRWATPLLAGSPLVHKY